MDKTTSIHPATRITATTSSVCRLIATPGSISAAAAGDSLANSGKTLTIISLFPPLAHSASLNYQLIATQAPPPPFHRIAISQSQKESPDPDLEFFICSLLTTLANVVIIPDNN